MIFFVGLHFDCYQNQIMCGVYIYTYFFVLFSHIYVLPASSGQAVVTGIVPSPPRFSPRAKGSAIPLLVDFSPSVANSRSRAFRKSICAQEKVPTNAYEYALGGTRTHETDLNQPRG